MNCYVYAYLRENGTPYYIGKGTGNRILTKHKNEIKPPKNKSRIIIVEKNLTNVGALALERRLIRCYGRKDLNTGILRNRTDGGDGCSGVVRTDEWRKNQSIKQTGRKLKTVRSEEYRKKISNAMKGRKITWKNKLSESQKGIPKPKKDRTKEYHFVSPDGLKVSTFNLSKFSQQYGLDLGAISKLSLGKRKTHKGWKKEITYEYQKDAI